MTPAMTISQRMKTVRKENTTPEIAVRRLLHRLGLRFRLHVRNLPGTPDIILPKYRTAIFVHGCFWHRHPGCKYASTPKTHPEYWIPKFQANVERDARKATELEALGWRVLTIGAARHITWKPLKSACKVTLDWMLSAIQLSKVVLDTQTNDLTKAHRHCISNHASNCFECNLLRRHELVVIRE